MWFQYSFHSCHNVIKWFFSMKCVTFYKDSRPVGIWAVNECFSWNECLWWKVWLQTLLLDIEDATHDAKGKNPSALFWCTFIKLTMLNLTVELDTLSYHDWSPTVFTQQRYLKKPKTLLSTCISLHEASILTFSKRCTSKQHERRTRNLSYSLFTPFLLFPVVEPEV